MGKWILGVLVLVGVLGGAGYILYHHFSQHEVCLYSSPITKIEFQHGQKWYDTWSVYTLKDGSQVQADWELQPVGSDFCVMKVRK